MDFTVRQASIILNIKVRTIRSWIHSGKLKAKKVGKRWLIPEEEIYSAEVQERANKNRRNSK